MTCQLPELTVLLIVSSHLILETTLGGQDGCNCEAPYINIRKRKEAQDSNVHCLDVKIFPGTPCGWKFAVE